mmetsp:Transcript_13093/g.38172  ORF Transcript_13093/g.38172 Transcript_13093/m.38172 type:complete len:254 (-) Transcript_13093:1008-1769(-)
MVVVVIVVVDIVVEVRVVEVRVVRVDVREELLLVVVEVVLAVRVLVVLEVVVAVVAVDVAVVMVAVLVDVVVAGSLLCTRFATRSWPPCEMASTLMTSLDNVRSMKPYMSSSPSAAGRPSDVMPPPPPEIRYGQPPRIASSSSPWTSCLCVWPEMKRSMPNLSCRYVKFCSAKVGGKCVTRICQSATDCPSTFSSHSIWSAQSFANQPKHSSTLAGPVVLQPPLLGLCSMLQRLWPSSLPGISASTKFVSTKK